MNTKLTNLYGRFRSSYWCIPSLMAILAMLLAVAMTELDRHNSRHHTIDLSWLELTGAEGAQRILSIVASSMITVTGIVFSVTIVTLSLTSQQFGPRLLQNFLRQHSNQFVLGMVTSTYLYCLLVLRSFRLDSTDFASVPHLSLLIAFVLAIVCVALLIFFIHNVAKSIQVTNVIDSVSRELSNRIQLFFPKKIQSSAVLKETEFAMSDSLPDHFSETAQPVPSSRNGYLQAIDLSGLLEFTRNKGLVVRQCHRLGHFIVAGMPLLEVWPGEKAESEELTHTLQSFFYLGHKRTPEQDIEFLIEELVEIACRALSPGVNDPFTAISCVNQLGAALCDLAQRAFPPIHQCDSDGQVRVVGYPVTFDCLVDASFRQIRQYSRGHVSVMIRMLEVIRVIIPFTHYPAQRDALLKHAVLIEKQCHGALAEEADREDVHERYIDILQTIEEHFGLTGESQL